jgi:ribosomal protein S27AE
MDSGRHQSNLFSRLRNWLWQTPTLSPTETARRVDRYRLRKRSLPNDYPAAERRRALEYWKGACAICGRPAGLWHTVVLDHWIPLSHPSCPGTLATNMIPMCHGNDGCNNHKHAKMPEQFLIEKLGKRKARKKLEEIEYFFKWMENPAVERASCPYCGKPVYYSQQDDVWECNYCQSTGALVMQYE